MQGRLLLLAVFGPLWLAVPARAQSTLDGLVHDSATGAPLDEAAVSVVGSSITTLTSRSGRFHLVLPSAGRVDLAIRRIGYAPRIVFGATVPPGGGPLEIALVRPAVPPLPDLVVLADPAFDRAPGLERVALRGEIRQQPFLGEDAYRTLTRAPGVEADEVSARFRIRGAEHQEVLVRLDGLTLIEPFHLKDLSGTFSMVDGHWIERSNVSGAGFGAEFGDRAGGVVEFATVDPGPASGRFYLSASPTHLRMATLGRAPDRRWSWLVSARRGVPDLVLSAIGGESRFSPRYMDATAKVTYSPSPTQQLSAHFLAGADRLLATEDGQDVVSESKGMRGYGWLRWQAVWGSHLRTETVASMTHVLSHRNVDFLPGYPDGVIDRRALVMAGLRHDATVLWGEHTSLKMGVEVQRAAMRYDYSFRAPIQVRRGAGAPLEHADTFTTILPVSGTTVSAYLAPILALGPRVQIEPGLRYDFHSYADEGRVSPRLRSRVTLARGVDVVGSWGMYAQTQGIHELDLATEPLRWHSQHAGQTTLGLHLTGAGGMQLQIEGYRRLLHDPWPRRINLDLGFEVVPESDSDDIIVAPDAERALGVDLSVSGRGGHGLAWRAGYSLSNVADELAGRWVPRPYDQRHAIVLDASRLLARDFTVSAAWQWHSGRPEPIPDFTEFSVQGGGRIIPGYHYETLGARRLPAYHRLDLRFRRETTLAGGRLAMALDLVNLYNHKNVLGVSNDGTVDKDGTITIRRSELTPVSVLPIIEVGWGF